MITAIIRYISVLALLFSLTACEGEQNDVVPSGKVVKVGFIGPQTGAYSGLGTNSLDGAKAALLLQPYLLNGDRVEIVDLDDKNNPQLATNGIDRLIKEESIVAVLLGSGSTSVVPVAQYLEQIALPGVALLATHPDVAKGKYTIQLPFDDTLQATVAALYVMDELIIDTVAVFVEPDDLHSSFLAETFVRKFIESGGEVETFEYPLVSNDLIERLTKLRDSGVELLYLPLNGPAVIEIQRACRGIGFLPEVMLSDGVLSRIALDYDSDLALVEGMMATDVFTNAKISSRYREEIKKSFEGNSSTLATTYAALGAEGMSILLHALGRCGTSSDRECITQNLHATTGFPGVNGPISINEDGKAERPIFINKIIDGKLVFEVMVY